MRYSALTFAVPLRDRLLPKPEPGRVALIAAWDDDQALDRFLSKHPLAEAMQDGWRTRLEPTHVFGVWPPLQDLLGEAQPMDEEEPAAVLTIGRLRFSQAVRFVKASAGAEQLAVESPAMMRGTGLTRPPSLVATFSLWTSTREMRAYAAGAEKPEHRAAVKAHAARPFHHASAFIRFRPYGSEGQWDGSNPLANRVPAAAPLA
ncbi:MAG TPA: hypothetical protein VMB05_03435 [Solirubrobacteraceae bacterium]|nr:hypothetical protein [Solirubrobacteraceae bacterium]